MSSARRHRALPSRPTDDFVDDFTDKRHFAS